MLNLMSNLFLRSNGFANPALLGVVGAVVAGCTLFLYYEGQSLQSSNEPPPATEQSAAVPELPEFPFYPNSTFLKKEIAQNCKNIDENHPPPPICESVNYIYTSPVSAEELEGWFTKEENTKPWICSGESQISCTNDKSDQFELMLTSSEIIYKTAGENYDDYSYLAGWQTVFGNQMMFSYPLDWTLDDSGLKSVDYEMAANTPGAPKLVNGCIIDRVSPYQIPDAQKQSEQMTLLGDTNAHLLSWENPTDKTFLFEIKSTKKTILMEVAKEDKVAECKEVLLNYAKSYKILEGSAPNYNLLETI